METHLLSPASAPPKKVFACRSPDRPNPIGLSVVTLERVVRGRGQPTRIHVKGMGRFRGVQKGSMIGIRITGVTVWPNRRALKSRLGIVFDGL